MVIPMANTSLHQGNTSRLVAILLKYGIYLKTVTRQSNEENKTQNNKNQITTAKLTTSETLSFFALRINLFSQWFGIKKITLMTVRTNFNKIVGKDMSH